MTPRAAWHRRLALCGCLLCTPPAGASALSLEPLYPGLYRNGDGANSLWVQVSEEWRGSLSGAEEWGTGIWGLADQRQVIGLSAGGPFVQKVFAGRVSQIDFADDFFNGTDALVAKWGTRPLAPLFSGAPGEYQDNIGARFSGYVAVTEGGPHNFSVLTDDGFQLSLFGQGGGSITSSRDGLSPPDRVGLQEDVTLSPGLYRFQLDAYERLEAAVVQLAWWTPAASVWSVIPQEHLFTHATPLPAGLGLGLSALAALGAVGLRRSRRPE